ncbi:MAG: nucleotidyltransferase family protein [Prevotellaceae bacterium]|jgi:NDP-sugar pyrophosphorylase family protein|nr:nucleotidyltransferase family protein [Prevotellaceae bacterium]
MNNENQISDKHESKKAMIFAAGLGTRLKPLTDNMPKALIPVAGKPMIEHLIKKLKTAGFTQIVINVHHFAGMIIDFLSSNNNFGVDIYISNEQNRLLDTGGGIKHAARFLQGSKPFLVHNVDIISNVDLNDIYEKHCSANAIATLLVSNRKTSRYLFFDKNQRLCGWQNITTNELKWTNTQVLQTECDKYAFGGIHVISPEIFNYFDNWNDKFSIIDFYLSQAQNICAYAPEKLRLIDIGKQESLMQAEKEFDNFDIFNNNY